MTDTPPSYAPDVQAAADALRAGKIRDAQSQIDQILDARPDDADALNLRVALLSMQGSFKDALPFAQRAAALRPDDPRLALNLASLLTNTGKLEAALEIFDQQIAKTPKDLRTLHDRGRVLTEIGRPKAACADLEAAIAIAPKVGDFHASLAEAHLKLQQSAAAQTAAQRAIELGEQSGRAHIALGRAQIALGDLAAARTSLATAVEIDPKALYPGAALVEVERRLGDASAAEAAADQFLRRAPVGMRRAGASEVTVLVLERFGERGFGDLQPTLHPHAGANFIGQAPAGRIAYAHAFIDRAPSAKAARAMLGEVGVIYNNWANAEAMQRSDAGAPLRAFLASARPGPPVINAPEDVAETTREANARAYADETRFLFPQTIMVPASSDGAEDVRRETILAKMRPPFILRPLSTHRGAGARVVESEAALDAALATLHDVDLYAIQYIDCSSADGVFRRYRMAVIDEQISPQNMHVASNWNVHGSERDAYDWDATGLRMEEEALLSEPEALLGGAPETVFASVLERTKLDIYGIDFGRRRSDGAIVVFEVNAAMSFTSVQLARRFPYLWPRRDRLTDQIEALFLRRATSG
ncbi:MAG: tetratricopeptide repeat protein [Pseudomonadota bacterium]